MTPTIEFEMDGMRKVMNSLYDALVGQGQSGDAITILKDEGRRLATSIMAFTPPLGPGGRNAGARKAGEAAIQRELNSLISEAHPSTIDEIGSKFGIHNIRTFLEGADKKPIEIRWVNLDPTGARLAQYHRDARDYRGKVKLWKENKGAWVSRVVVPEGTRHPYIDKVKKRVGRWRASVGAIIPYLGGKLPSWIAAHVSSTQAIQILDISKLNHPTYPELTFGTRAPGIENPQYRYKERIAAAMRSRIRNMKKRCELVLSGYSKDVSNRIRPRKRAKESTTEPEIPME